MTISDEKRLRFENQQKQEELEEIEKKNLELQDMSRRIDDLENGPKAMSAEYFRNMFEFKDRSSTRVLLTMFMMWFEMRATESEKKII